MHAETSLKVWLVLDISSAVIQAKDIMCENLCSLNMQ